MQKQSEQDPALAAAIADLSPEERPGIFTCTQRIDAAELKQSMEDDTNMDYDAAYTEAHYRAE